MDEFTLPGRRLPGHAESAPTAPPSTTPSETSPETVPEIFPEEAPATAPAIRPEAPALAVSVPSAPTVPAVPSIPETRGVPSASHSLDDPATPPVPRPSSQVGSSAREATLALFRSADRVRRGLTGVVEARGLTLQQYNVLLILRDARGGPLRASEIGDRLIEETPGTTRLLDRLETGGFIRRERSSDDRRVVLSWITPTGKRLLAELDPVADSVDQRCVAALTEGELTRLVELLAKLGPGGKDDPLQG